ncbi:hypothetical protein [Roseobacter phage RDJL3]|nr:hypothetical protein [Roseobacter phage RDJL3]
MTKAANILVCGLLFLLILNGVRLTFFPLHACHLVRGNQMPTLEESVMEFHKSIGSRAYEGGPDGTETE